MNTLTIYVTDLDKSKAFYTEQLGFEAGEEMSPGILLQSGDVTLYIEAGRKKRTSKLKEYSEFSPCFETDSVKQTYEVLKFSGVRLWRNIRNLHQLLPCSRLLTQTAT